MITIENLLNPDLSKAKKGKCVTKFCRGKKGKGRLVCNKCRYALYKMKDPVGCAFTRLKSNAKRREKEFTLTLEEFKKFCEETNYIELKGRHKSSMTIDRKDSTKGYSYNNIKILSMSSNASKGNRDVPEEDECPF